ncbi:MAG TPA: glycosyltransferase family 2 protein [Jiangellaceae bacterium]|nr:glycosyltransferase family 2 protein [Jiangellaceae bacterium]
MLRVAVIIPAKDEQARIAATVKGASSLPGVDLVLVVDDGSTDATAAAAHGAGAVVIRHARNRGKGAAMHSGAQAVDDLNRTEPDAVGSRALLFLDADLEDTAAEAAPLIEPVREGSADMTIAILPPQRSSGGGHGLVVRLARVGIERATGWPATQPLSGQRCLTRTAFLAALPLADGFGVEVGLSIDLLRRGYRVREVEVPFHHRVTGADWRSQVHRGRQWLDVARALLWRGVAPFVLPGVGRRQWR